MKNDFLPYLDEVGKIEEESKDESSDNADDHTTKEKQKRRAERLKQLTKKKLSKETYHGIQMTGVCVCVCVFVCVCVCTCMFSKLVDFLHLTFCSLLIH